MDRRQYLKAFRTILNHDAAMRDCATFHTCNNDLSAFSDMCSDVGIPLADDKTFSPDTTMTFLGIELDTLAMEERLPQDKPEQFAVPCDKVESVFVPSLEQVKSNCVRTTGSDTLYFLETPIVYQLQNMCKRRKSGVATQPKADNPSIASIHSVAHRLVVGQAGDRRHLQTQLMTLYLYYDGRRWGHGYRLADFIPAYPHQKIYLEIICLLYEIQKVEQ
ncbi:hypothetical protein Bbelb_334680 [Branchiostoma belcheri]|nr:hypothetical protein Bbelb_334680 [Branchiostoma belcheri]